MIDQDRPVNADLVAELRAMIEWIEEHDPTDLELSAALDELTSRYGPDHVRERRGIKRRLTGEN